MGVKGFILSKIKKFHLILSGNKIGFKTYISYDTLVEKYINVERNTKLIDCRIGKGTDIASNCKFVKCKIGKYCVIGDNCMNIYGHHPIFHYVAMNSKFYAPQKRGFTTKWLYKELYKYIDKEKKYFTEIGNDVYITHDVKILEGVKIGDGAVITPGSVVTKNVPPYAIVRGNPAKIEMYRFKNEEIEFLQNIKWWDKDDEWIKKNIDNFSNIKIFKEKFEGEL